MKRDINVESYELKNVEVLGVQNEITILPTYIQNSSGKSIYTKETISFIKYLNQNKLRTGLSETNPENFLYQDNKSIDWISPIIFIGNAIITNPDGIKLLIDTISYYVSEKLEHIQNSKAKCTFIYEDRNSPSSYKKITYEGDIAGLKDVNDIVSSMKNE